MSGQIAPAVSWRTIKVFLLVSMLAVGEARRVQENVRLGHGSKGGDQRMVSDREFQEQVNHFSTLVKTMKSSTSSQEQFERLARQVEVKIDRKKMEDMLTNPSIQEKAKRMMEQLDTIRTTQSSQEHVLSVSEQMEGILADPKFQELVSLAVKQVDEIMADSAVQEHAKHIEEQLEPLMGLFTEQVEGGAADSDMHGSRQALATFLLSRNPESAFKPSHAKAGIPLRKPSSVRHVPTMSMTSSGEQARTGTATIQKALQRVAKIAARAKTIPRMTAAAASQARAPWKGAKLKPLAMSVAVGLVIRYLCPIPASLDPQAWSILAIFAATIAGIVTAPLPPPGVAICALAVGALTGTFTFAQGVAAFSDEVIWLVVLAFFFAKGFSKTGLGDRIALNVVKKVGGTTLGLAYGLNAAEGIIAAGMPSSAARAAGLFYPIVQSVAKATGSDPKDGTEKKTGAFLVQSSFQATGNSCSLWLFGAAQNLLALRLASQLGYDLPSPFATWFVANCVPALAAMALTPLVVYKFLPPEAKLTPDAPLAAEKSLKEMGPISRDEKILGTTVLGMLSLWAGSTALGIAPVNTAMAGLGIMLLTGTLTWGDCASEKGAWTTMTWFAILVSMSAMLSKLGVVGWVADSISKVIFAAGLSAGPAFLLLLGLYSGVHYLFASQVAHLSALYVPFISMMVKTGTPPTVALLSLATASNLFASLTPYASAQAPVFFGGNYVSKEDWYKLGFIFLIFNHVVWLGLGAVWWKVLGLY